MRGEVDIFVMKMECRDDGEKSTASDASVNKARSEVEITKLKPMQYKTGRACRYPFRDCY